MLVWPNKAETAFISCLKFQITVNDYLKCFNLLAIKKQDYHYTLLIFTGGVQNNAVIPSSTPNWSWIMSRISKLTLAKEECFCQKQDIVPLRSLSSYVMRARDGLMHFLIKKEKEMEILNKES